MIITGAAHVRDPPMPQFLGAGWLGATLGAASHNAGGLTVLAGTDFLIVNTFLTDTTANSRNVTGVTFGGVAMTQAVGGGTILGATVVRSNIWYLRNPAAGSNAVIATANGVSSMIAAEYICAKNLNRLDKTAQGQATSGTTLTPIPAVSSGKSLVVMAACMGGASAPTGTTATLGELEDRSDFSGVTEYAAYTIEESYVNAKSYVLTTSVAMTKGVVNLASFQ